MAGDGETLVARGGIVPDPVDIRDRAYEPTLARLSASLLPDPKILAALRRRTQRPWFLPRVQGDEGTCGGQALAALIDLDRLRSGVTGTARYSVSARMLYECARLRQDGPAEGVSLRDIIKAFHNYGACSDALWPYEPNGPPGALSYQTARDARRISLGAYYRLRPNLNTYHSALHEAGAVLVSAELHAGWTPDQLRDGTIEPPRFAAGAPAFDEAHAFVIIGYTPAGFLVLNSWGPDWGGWTPPAAGGRGKRLAQPETPVPGVALWRYEDWADRVIDGWVLRLGVGAAEAFDYSIGDMGLGFGVDTSVRSTPVHAVIGHFLHLDDGDFVASGAYVSTGRTLDEIEALLTADDAPPVHGISLTFAGALQGMREGIDHVARWKRLALDAGWHPLTVLWCADYVEDFKALLGNVAQAAAERAGKPGAQLDGLIEARLHGIGRAVWRDIAASADRAARPGGPLQALARTLTAIDAGRGGLRLRVIAESEGVFALHACVQALDTETAIAGRFFEQLESVDLIAPPIESEAFHALAAALDRGWGRQRPGRAVRVHLPKAEDERRLTVPPYGRSHFDLVERALRGRTPPTAPATGALPVHGVFSSRWDGWETAPRVRLVPIEWKSPPDPQKPLTQTELVYRSDVAGRLHGALRDPDSAAETS